MKIIDYTILRWHSENGLREKVLEMLSNGWSLYGSPSAHVLAVNEPVIMQCMVKYEEKPNDHLTLTALLEKDVFNG